MDLYILKLLWIEKRKQDNRLHLLVCVRESFLFAMNDIKCLAVPFIKFSLKGLRLLCFLTLSTILISLANSFAILHFILSRHCRHTIDCHRFTDLLNSLIVYFIFSVSSFRSSFHIDNPSTGCPVLWPTRASCVDFPMYYMYTPSLKLGMPFLLLFSQITLT